MPCSSGYLEPTRREIEHQRAARLLIYVYRQKGEQVPNWIIEQSTSIYAKDERLIPLLCSELKKMTKEEIERIVYNAKDKTSRELADWKEEHDAADQERERREKKSAKFSSSEMQHLKNSPQRSARL